MHKYKLSLLLPPVTAAAAAVAAVDVTKAVVAAVLLLLWLRFATCDCTVVLYADMQRMQYQISHKSCKCISCAHEFKVPV
jgi:hypothetical protein